MHITHSAALFLLKHFTDLLSFLFLLPDRVGVDRIIEPQDVQAEQTNNQGVHSRHQPGDGHTQDQRSTYDDRLLLTNG